MVIVVLYYSNREQIINAPHWFARKIYSNDPFKETLHQLWTQPMTKTVQFWGNHFIIIIIYIIMYDN